MQVEVHRKFSIEKKQIQRTPTSFEFSRNPHSSVSREIDGNYLQDLDEKIELSFTLTSVETLITGKTLLEPLQFSRSSISGIFYEHSSILRYALCKRASVNEKSRKGIHQIHIFTQHSGVFDTDSRIE